jgi:hypothetical protein
MKRLLLAALLGVFLFAGCVVGPGPRGSGVVVVPALPSIVVLETEPYYYQGGYHCQGTATRKRSGTRAGAMIEERVRSAGTRSAIGIKAGRGREIRRPRHNSRRKERAPW